jgi:hypothetical protein
MRYTITRLCGGEALMLIPRDLVGTLSLERIRDGFQRQGVPARMDGPMLIMNWEGMEVTVYEPGKIMFHPLKDRNRAIDHANTLFEMFRDMDGVVE